MTIRIPFGNQLLLRLVACVAPLGMAAGLVDAQDAPASALRTATLHIGSAELDCELAITPAQEERGLMYRDQLPDNSGMLFYLPGQQAVFWMENTRIPLSIAFLDKEGVVLEIHDMKAMDTTRVKSDSYHVYYAVEANLHWFALNKIKPGDKVSPSPEALRAEVPGTPVPTAAP